MEDLVWAAFNKMLRTVGLKKETFIYQSSGGWQDQDQGAG